WAIGRGSWRSGCLSSKKLVSRVLPCLFRECQRGVLRFVTQGNTGTPRDGPNVKPTAVGILADATSTATATTTTRPVGPGAVPAGAIAAWIVITLRSSRSAANTAATMNLHADRCRFANDASGRAAAMACAFRLKLYSSLFLALMDGTSSSHNSTDSHRVYRERNPGWEERHLQVYQLNRWQ
ncbi:unnamed protein product, partial [Sphacelaria rigidula]